MSQRICTWGGVEGFGCLAMRMTALAATVLVALSSPAIAASDTYRQEGVTLRLVALSPDAEGRVQAALAVDLDPGWKTYWIAPGPVGLAPALNFSASVGLDDPAVSLPVPIRFAEGDAQSVGYDEPVAFAIEAHATSPSPVLRLSALLGVCRELCVPVQASLEAAPSKSLSDRALVARAQSSAPPVAGSLAVASARWNAKGDALLIDAPSVREETSLEAFVSAGDGWSFGPPLLDEKGSKPVLSLPVLSRPSTVAELRSIDILLTIGESAQLSRAVPVASR